MRIREKYVKVREAAAILGVCQTRSERGREPTLEGFHGVHRHPVKHEMPALPEKSDLEKLIAQVERTIPKHKPRPK